MLWIQIQPDLHHLVRSGSRRFAFLQVRSGFNFFVLLPFRTPHPNPYFRIGQLLKNISDTKVPNDMLKNMCYSNITKVKIISLQKILYIYGTVQCTVYSVQCNVKGNRLQNNKTQHNICDTKVQFTGTQQTYQCY